jgi:hypothetical protein
MKGLSFRPNGLRRSADPCVISRATRGLKASAAVSRLASGGLPLRSVVGRAILNSSVSGYVRLSAAPASRLGGLTPDPALQRTRLRRAAELYVR